MEKLSVFLFTSILGKKMYDEFNDVLGELKDIYVTTDDGYPRVIGYKVRRDGVTFHYEFRSIIFYSIDNNVKIMTRGSKEILPRTYSYLLSRNLLDKKIVDINGKQVVRVDDLRIAEIAGEYRVIAVETGPLAKFRRMKCQGLGKFIYKVMNKDYDDKVLMWDDVESLEMVNKNLQISVPYKKLSTLHPADLADILENLDAGHRKQIIESLDEDLAADTLEEIEPEYRGSILKDLSEAKAAEVLENMPNDEIADILDELNDDEREKILVNLETEDAEEVKELLKYEDETVGSVMSKDFIAFNLDITIGEIIDILRETNPEDEELNSIFIKDEEDRLIGVLGLKDLLLNDSSVKAKEIMNENIDVLKHYEDIHEAVEISAKYDLLTIPVVDEKNMLIGVVNTHDLIDEILYPIWKKKNK
ncbi:magnesium transporter [Clostridium celatum]|uniref:MgtE intracellular domain protein n=1 Tax=Clostridium celatum DSM 1785 TaxID=545697 RepID=L1QJM0_9CLOT|nr:CBS domain-containing protein [Clostridium celatum]EKY28173.1 MgtE intracellular domain protein [Clostridium celatum DSM 1785]MCE9654070.1 CBS domain-containing protein [Clostridium celatum]MDU3723328.1 CBS domain-containing protein [Clostridium celatum]MDY3359633.1 CBS domain-containing protein [Clostridium celatum]